MQILSRIKLAPKIFFVVALLSLVAMVIAIIGITTMNKYDTMVDDSAGATKRALYGENTNAMIYAVVMDSRGIYMSNESSEAEKYAKGMEVSLAKIEKNMAAWQAILPADKQAAFVDLNETAKKFMEFRSEMVRISRTDGPAAARVWGDNPENRANRTKLNELMAAEAQKIAAEVEHNTEELTLYYQSALTSMLTITIIGLGAGIGLALLIVIGGLTRPLNSMTATMGSLAAGHLKIDIEGIERDDEIGDMAKALAIFKESMIKNQDFTEETRRQTDEIKRQSEATERQAAEIREASAEMARQSEIQSKRAAVLDQLVVEFNDNVDVALNSLGTAARDMDQTSTLMKASADRAAGQSTAVASASAQASANVHTVAAASEEMNSSILEIGRLVIDASQIAGRAVTTADKTSGTILALSDSAEKIGAVVQMINSIASQTNLLALNATIEAARAGEAGKGFAVVASEVKSLANESAKATEEISAQISRVQDETEGAVAAIQEVSGIIHQINEIAATIAAAVEEQGAATQEIARNVQEAAKGTSEVSSNIVGVNSAVTETRSEADKVSVTAQHLKSNADQLRTQIDNFLARVKAA
ncbi:methyl-accepting chemotaxis protein [Govanella unica]|uniref:Methyl-accepting chemotaxis protein n=1 Tax=Govanella unica TaxID=2975056 RepID=A0A9X3TYN3_9PROT|nr:methyl-accepting chemotaxis protein [Govania unica]MDA5194159.1 methyl-accepting chemotaxis protein [Govania unica]